MEPVSAAAEAILGVSTGLLILFAAILFVGVMFLALFAFWVWMLVDCAVNEPEGSNKIAWILILIFVPPPILGGLIYFLARKIRRDSANVTQPKVQAGA